MRHINMRRLVAVIAVSVFAVLGCDEQETSGPGDPGFVSVGDNYFAPQVVHPNAIGTVTWVYGGNASHDIVFVPGQGGQVAPPVSSGVYYRSFATEAAGTYNYRCTLHAGMVGQVIWP